MHFPVNSTQLRFAGSQHALLDARLDAPLDVAPRGYLIFSHCFTCTKETLTTARVARGLAQQGYAVLRFDFTGLGASAGNFADSNFTSMVEDIRCAANYLQQHYQSPCALLGHSMGGTASLLASRDIRSCNTVVTLAAPAQPAHVLHHFGPVLQQLEAGQAAQISVAGVRYPVLPQFIHDVRALNMQQLMQGYELPVLVISAEHDALVMASAAQEIFGYTRGPSQMLAVPAADHLFTDRAATLQMIDAIVIWLQQQGC